MTVPHTIEDAYIQGHQVNYTFPTALLDVQYRPVGDRFRVKVGTVDHGEELTPDEALSLDILKSIIKSRNQTTPHEVVICSDKPELSLIVSGEVLGELGDIAVRMTEVIPESLAA